MECSYTRDMRKNLDRFHPMDEVPLLCPIPQPVPQTWSDPRGPHGLHVVKRVDCSELPANDLQIFCLESRPSPQSAVRAAVKWDGKNTASIIDTLGNTSRRDGQPGTGARGSELV
jgi:hypothetical protein